MSETLRAEINNLVGRFSEALATKMMAAEAKHGWQGAWTRSDWEEQLRGELLRHVGKGDPLDVAAYCAFAWHHGWSTASAGAEEAETLALILALRADEANSVTILCDNPDFNGLPDRSIECNGDWTDYEDLRFAGDTLLACLREAHSAMFSFRQSAHG